MAKILVVDDEKVNLTLLSRRLKSAGFEVLEAKDGYTALEVLDKENFDLILLDIMMPGIDGFEVAQNILKHPEQQKIPIIFLTARSSVESKLEGLSLGAVDYITKPFDFRELLVRIKNIIQQNQKKKSLEKQREDLEKLAFEDALTGLYNRHYMEKKLKKELKAKSGNLISSLILFDIDYFKRINDTYGHDQGDLLLKEIARLTKRSIRDQDIAGRYGGDEFFILLPGVSGEDANIVAERIRKDVENLRIRLNGKGEQITISVGVSTFVKGKEQELNTQDWIRRTDKALYQAKKAGRNRVFRLE
ncbi:MAG: diguanylate cyclase [Clostridiaceae bacterium]|nr:diguanylate cyclase [Clostridiaceae bacterium]